MKQKFIVLDLGPVPKISYYVFENISKSEILSISGPEHLDKEWLPFPLLRCYRCDLLPKASCKTVVSLYIHHLHPSLQRV